MPATSSGRPALDQRISGRPTGLGYHVDIAYRILASRARDRLGSGLGAGQRTVGRPTAGVTWSSNNICNLIWKSSDDRMSPDRIFVAPHAPGLSVENLPDREGLRSLEKTYRQIWCQTQASVDVARRMFHGYEAFVLQPFEPNALPSITSLDDHAACVARLCRIMEDPQQLRSNCVADYIVEELRRCNYRPEHVRIPGFTNIDYLSL